MHLNLMTKLHACHAQMKLDPDLQTLRETDLHMDLHSARAPSPCMHAFPKERDHNSREKAKAGQASRPGREKKSSKAACMHGFSWPWLVGLVQSHEKAATAAAQQQAFRRSDGPDRSTCIYVSSDELLRSDPDYNHLLLAYCSLFYRRSYLVDQKGQRPLARREQFAAASWFLSFVQTKPQNTHTMPIYICYFSQTEEIKKERRTAWPNLWI